MSPSWTLIESLVLPLLTTGMGVLYALRPMLLAAVLISSEHLLILMPSESTHHGRNKRT
jgi:hypothetical protein